MRRFYWQISGIRWDFSSTLDPGELFYNILRAIPDLHEIDAPILGENMRLFGSSYITDLREVVSFKVETLHHPYLNVDHLFNMRDDLVAYLRRL